MNRISSGQRRKVSPTASPRSISSTREASSPNVVVSIRAQPIPAAPAPTTITSSAGDGRSSFSAVLEAKKELVKTMEIIRRAAPGHTRLCKLRAMGHTLHGKRGGKNDTPGASGCSSRELHILGLLVALEVDAHGDRGGGEDDLRVGALAVEKLQPLVTKITPPWDSSCRRSRTVHNRAPSLPQSTWPSSQLWTTSWTATPWARTARQSSPPRAWASPSWRSSSRWCVACRMPR
eukprot:scaffold81933_cov64-Phaeocystis_antarctica.AAC.1